MVWVKRPGNAFFKVTILAQYEMYKKEKIRLFFVIVISFRNGYKIYKSRIVLGVVTSHYEYIHKGQIDQIHKKLICLENLT